MAMQGGLTDSANNVLVLGCGVFSTLSILISTRFVDRGHKRTSSV